MGRLGWTLRNLISKETRGKAQVFIPTSWSLGKKFLKKRYWKVHLKYNFFLTGMSESLSQRIRNLGNWVGKAEGIKLLTTRALERYEDLLGFEEFVWNSSTWIQVQIVCISGFHSETKIMTTLLALLFWDIIFREHLRRLFKTRWFMWRHILLRGRPARLDRDKDQADQGWKRPRRFSRWTICEDYVEITTASDAYRIQFDLSR